VSLDPIGPPGSAVETFGVLGCPVCQAEPAIEAEAVTWFCRQAFDDPDGRGRVLAAGGLCPRHWWQVATEEESSRATMLGTAELRLERWLAQWVTAQQERELAAALAAARRYVRTRQHRYRAEATRTEADELRAALAVLLGAPGQGSDRASA
jgi:hypothetical protein